MSLIFDNENIQARPGMDKRILTWPNQDDRMNMTKSWQKWTLFIEHGGKIINITTATKLKV